jgi:glutamate 5-kinase
MKEMNKIVVKLGTSSLTQGGQKLSLRHMLALVQQIVHLQNLGKQVVLVSSGAVAAGKEVLDASLKEQALFSKQMVASIGQAKLMQAWSELFSLFECKVGQVLLTKEDFSDPIRNQNAQETIGSLLEHRVLPIINENDAVSTKESKIGDNDNLAALVAGLLSADAVILLTDQEGLYTSDPRKNPNAELISVVTYIDEETFALAGASATTLGTGGMITKIEAAKVAAKSGICTLIASSTRPNILIDLVDGKRIGTLFQEEKMT